MTLKWKGDSENASRSNKKEHERHSYELRVEILKHVEYCCTDNNWRCLI
jgi:hypothetical protein